MLSRNLLLVALLAGLPFAAAAQEAPEEDGESGFSWNAAVTSDYRFRGASQTDGEPALQAGIDYNFANGFYVGAWASNVDFGDSTDIEVDAYVGWNRDLSETTNLDLQLVRYAYTGQPAGVEYGYSELVGKLTFNENYSLTVGYTNDYLNESVDSTYVALGGNWAIGGDVNLSASVGKTFNTDGIPSYLDYSVGLDRDFGPANVALAYVGTDGKGKDLFGEDLAKGKVVLTVSFGF